MDNGNQHDDPLKFAALIAHQIKSPVGAAGSLLKTMLGEYAGHLTARQKDILSRADRRIDEAILTVSRLLTIVRAEQSDNSAVTEASALVYCTVERAIEEAGARGISVEQRIDIESACVRMSESALSEALSSLLSNAVKYTPDHGKIIISLEHVDNGDRIRIHIDDSGIGVPEDQREKIFEPFYRTENARNTALPGVGLGLAFVRALVKAAGGSISVGRSELGGARFTMELPGQAGPVPMACMDGADRRLRVLIIGGMAAGPKVAAKVIRMKPDAQVTIVEKGHLLSYAGCGLPFYISGVVKDKKEILSTPLGAVRDSVFFMNLKNVEVKNRTEAVTIDRAARRVKVLDLVNGRESWLPYDKLVIATGAKAVVPDLKGLHLGNIFTLHGFDEAERIRALMAARRAKDVVIIGGGLIGLEVTEAIMMQGCRVTIIEARNQIMYRMDWEIAKLLERYMESKGVRILKETRAVEFTGDENVKAVVTTNGTLPCDLVIMGIGVQPNVELSRRAGIEIGATGAIKVDGRMLTSDPDIYAAGDCVENTDIITGKPRFIPLGSTANKHGRVVAVNICGGNDTFPGVLGSTICKIFDYCVGRTGLSEADARREGFDALSVLVASIDREHFMPGTGMLMLKLIVDRSTRRLLGLQAIGTGDGSKRIDIAATAITAGMTVDSVASLDLCYAPPYSLAMDNIITAANIARNKLEGLYKSVTAREVHEWMNDRKDFMLLDLSTPDEHDECRLPGSMLVPLGTLRSRMQELPRDRDIVVFCRLSVRGYEAALIMQAAGFTRVYVLDGGTVMWPYELVRGR